MALRTYTPRRPGKRRRNLYFERIMAIVAATNLALVAFDLTYVPWRNFWLQSNLVVPFTKQRIHLPFPTMTCTDRSVERGQPARSIQQSVVTCLYDPVKGIEPHRETQAYLRTAAQLETQLAQTGVAPGLQSSEVQQTLAQLRQQSEEMLVQNPFAAVGKSGTLERIRNEIRRRVRRRTGANVGATEAFQIFWSTNNPTYPNYLSATTYDDEIKWFNTTLRPLIETNYFRGIGENGEPTNNFWLLDAPFVTLFFLEFLARTFYISNRYRSLTWLDAMIWRWYDIPLFLPFSLMAPILALTRVVPVTLRLHQAKLINLEAINARAREGFVAAIAEEITEVVVVQVVNQVQGVIRRGEFTKLLERTTNRQYVHVNDVDEVEELAKHMTQLFVYQVFPKVQPDLEALIKHSVMSVVGQSPMYQGLSVLPGMTDASTQIVDRLVSDLTQTVYDTLKTSLEDPKTTELAIQLARNFTTAMVTEVNQQNNLDEIQKLLTDLLEEVKINYIQRLSEEDATLILDETRLLKKESTSK